MKRLFLSLLLFSTLLVVGCTQEPAETVYRLYYLGGQSNMDGYGYVSELPDSLQSPVEGVLIFHGNMGEDGKPVDGRGVWETLRPGHGGPFKSDGETNEYSTRFGVELTFARRIQALHPGERIALIKYSRGGTTLDVAGSERNGSWAPDYSGGEGEGTGINQYDNFLATVDYARSVSDIDGDGIRDRLVPSGIVWMQGESDAGFDEAVANRYLDHLTDMMGLIREKFGTPDLPIVIGRISDSGNAEDGMVWKYGDIIRSAQAAFVEADAHAALVTSTDNYGYSDPWHYDSPGFIDLGVQFANALESIPAE
jgi:Carbohydrate esterase, sialic acid-specific acetylesterase